MKQISSTTLKGHMLVLTLISMLISSTVSAITIQESRGALETAVVTWDSMEGAACYSVSCSGEGISITADAPLIRYYEGYWRCDIPGLRTGKYQICVTALNGQGQEISRAVTDSVTVKAQNREGFAFNDNNVPGAYASDGTLKNGARVIYVTNETVNNVTCSVADKKGKLTVYTGLANILSAYGKGYDKTPLCVRIIGKIPASSFDGLKDGNYINLQGSNNSTRLLENVTIEGVGTDATLYGYGICLKRSHNVELRNLGIMLFGNDAISMDTDNTNIWVHNNDFFYGSPGSDADQVKGDGSIDMKYHSSLVTISYNHFFDSGKVMGCGGTTGEDENLMITFHHNWFDHADSRCPRLHYTTAHIYNNYYDGVPVYCIGNTSQSNAFVEGNYFRGVKRPMMISGQGTDKYDETTGTYTLKGTFSGQDGGMTKAFDNAFAECTPKLVYQTQNSIQFDAWLVESREEQVPSTAKSVTGGWVYNNFDTAPDMYASTPDCAVNVPSIVTTWAGRTDGGDFKWTFNNSVDDADHSVNSNLKASILSYESGLLAVQGQTSTSDLIDSVRSIGGQSTVVYDMSGRRVAYPTKGLYIISTNGKAVKKAMR
ncbi:pectate lyase family protein [Prevotella sp.]|uniref:pectate lyase family protein n=1 Tax=Prevotella sp. TaxID=59823 RepID=UPI003FD7F04A